MSEGHICKIHQKECIQRSEENYFFRLSKYWDDIRRHIENNPDFILPTSRRSQVLVWLEEDNKRDFSISRASTSWGIPVPDDDSQAAGLWSGETDRVEFFEVQRSRANCSSVAVRGRASVRFFEGQYWRHRVRMVLRPDDNRERCPKPGTLCRVLD